MSARKRLSPPPGTDDLTRVLRARHVSTRDDVDEADDVDQAAADAPPPRPQQQPPPEPVAAAPVASTVPVTSPAPPSPAAAAADAPAAAPARARRPAGPVMDRRSWYMPRDSAEALAAAVDELHWGTRRPKHEVVAALVEVAVRHADEARQTLAERAR